MLTVVFPFCSRDYALTKSLLLWIDDLGGCRKFSCCLFADVNVTDTDVNDLKKIAKLVFKSVTVAKTPYAIKLSKTGDCPWPCGPNWSFYSYALLHSMTSSAPFLWLESDCVPMKSGWLEAIDSEYESSGKLFLGPVIETQNKSFKPRYLNGTSVYCAGATKHFHSSMVDFLKGAGNAFDIAASSNTVPNAHFTNLIQHGYTDDMGINRWGTHPNPPLVFKASKEAGDPDNVVTPKVIRPETVLFHPCKNGSLIELLRKQREQVKVAA